MIDRDWIEDARAAMQGLIAKSQGLKTEHGLYDFEWLAKDAAAIADSLEAERERRSDHVCENKTLSQTVAHQHKTIEKLQERIAELEQRNRRLSERTDEMRANAQLVIDAPELARQNERLRSLLQEIYDWTAYKETEWAKKTYAALQESGDD